MKIVHVKWLDANGGTKSGWRSLQSMGGDPTETHSTGLLLKDDLGSLIVVPHWTKDGDGDGEITIPKACVQSVLVVGEA